MAKLPLKHEHGSTRRMALMIFAITAGLLLDPVLAKTHSATPEIVMLDDEVDEANPAPTPTPKPTPKKKLSKKEMIEESKRDKALEESEDHIIAEEIEEDPVFERPNAKAKGPGIEPAAKPPPVDAFSPKDKTDILDAPPAPVRNVVKPNAPLEPEPEPAPMPASVKAAVNASGPAPASSGVTAPTGVVRKKFSSFTIEVEKPEAPQAPTGTLEATIVDTKKPNPASELESTNKELQDPRSKGDSFVIKSVPAAPLPAASDNIKIDPTKVPKTLPAKKMGHGDGEKSPLPVASPKREEASARVFEKAAPKTSSIAPAATPALVIKYPKLTKKQWAKMTKKQKAKYLKNQKAEQLAHAKIRREAKLARKNATLPGAESTVFATEPAAPIAIDPNAPYQDPSLTQLVDEDVEIADPVPEREPAEDGEIIAFKDTIRSIVDFNEQWEVNFTKNGRYKIRGQPNNLFDYQQSGQFLEVQVLESERRILSIQPTKVRFRPIR